MSRYRTNSAGGGSRAGSAGSENRALREQIGYLQQQLMFSKAETQKVTDQLNCLISLIKRAWTGDKTASVHVANIVGVAPPDVHQEIFSDVGISVVTKPKSRAVNNWAVLTIGVLNREYKIRERELAEKQRYHLQRRQDYLEEQLLYARDMQAHLQARPSRPNSAYHHNGLAYNSVPVVECTAPQESHCTSATEGLTGNHAEPDRHLANQTPQMYARQHIQMPEKISVNKPPSAKQQRKPSAKSLYRKPRDVEPESNLTWANLVVEPSTASNKINKTTELTMGGLYHLPSYDNGVINDDLAEEGVEEPDDDRMYIAYDDPQRYTKYSLYDVEGALGSDAMAKRRHPLSGQLRQADNLRARPKSAVNVKSERSLKFETTRPISAQVSSSRTKDNRPVSGRTSQRDDRPRQYVTMDTTSYSNHSVRSPEVQSPKAKNSSHLEQGEGGAPLENVIRDLDIGHLMKVDVTRPECIKQFDEDLKEMDNMERDFKKRAVDLQKKLGITSDGMLYPDL